MEPDKNWEVECENCGELPTVIFTSEDGVEYGSELCGPCCFGEAATVGGNW